MFKPPVRKKKLIEVLSSGGGTQSTAIIVLILQGKLPRPDFVVIADTGHEMPTTWTYLDSVVRPALLKIGIEVHRIGQEYCREKVIGVFTNDSLQMPAYSNKGGGASKLSAFCSSHWKVEVIDRWLSHTKGITRSKYIKWIGFSFDETNRILRMQNGREYKSGLIRFPLVEIPTRRHESVNIVTNYGWPIPPRSRCFDCPNQSDKEWAEVKNNFPPLFQKSIELDESIRLRDPNAFLHSSIKPLRNADLSEEDDFFSSGCNSGECFL